MSASDLAIDGNAGGGPDRLAGREFLPLCGVLDHGGRIDGISVPRAMGLRSVVSQHSSLNQLRRHGLKCLLLAAYAAWLGSLEHESG